MIKNYILILFSITYLSSYAQMPVGRPHFQGGEKLRAIKIGMITEQLNLSETQAERFWPIYNTYSEERKNIHKKVRFLTQRNEGFSNEDLLKRQDEILELKQQDINLVKKYREAFLKIITPQQYANMMQAESAFNEILLQKLKERRQQRD